MSDFDHEQRAQPPTQRGPVDSPTEGPFDRQRREQERDGAPISQRTEDGTFNLARTALEKVDKLKNDGREAAQQRVQRSSKQAEGGSWVDALANAAVGLAVGGILKMVGTGLITKLAEAAKSHNVNAEGLKPHAETVQKRVADRMSKNAADALAAAQSDAPKTDPEFDQRFWEIQRTALIHLAASNQEHLTQQQMSPELEGDRAGALTVATALKLSFDDAAKEARNIQLAASTSQYMAGLAQRDLGTRRNSDGKEVTDMTDIKDVSKVLLEHGSIPTDKERDTIKKAATSRGVLNIGATIGYYGQGPSTWDLSSMTVTGAGVRGINNMAAESLLSVPLSTLSCPIRIGVTFVRHSSDHITITRDEAGGLLLSGRFPPGFPEGAPLEHARRISDHLLSRSLKEWNANLRSDLEVDK